VDKPSKPVVIYDGACGICAGNLKWLYRFDWLKKFDAMPYQAVELLQMFPQLKLEECEKTMHLVFPDGRIYTGSDAFRKIFLRMPVTFLAGVIMAIPPLPWAFCKLYPIVARNRYRIGGTCEIHERKAP
jgi:predicted DCC family thiol-disulfide oxidoreductase YuxK